MMKKFLFVSIWFSVFFTSSSAESCPFHFGSACEIFAYSKYLPEVGDEHAFSLAASACQIVSDVKVLTFLWSKHAKTNSPAHAMDLAIEERPGTLDGKLEMLTYAWSWYMAAGLDYSPAATKAAAGCARITNLNCLVSEISKRHQDYKLSPDRIDQAFDACVQRI